ncbi:MAG: DCC1-like thiol-disulfide oxidoreductase family protein [Planctomycetota bacterium]
MADLATTPSERAAGPMRGWVVAVVYLVIGLVLLGDDAWRYGSALWPAGPFGLPMAVGRVLTWAVLGSMLGLGLSWPVADVRRWVWGISLGVLVVIPIAAGWWWAALIAAGLHLVAFDPGWLKADRISGMTATTPQLEPLFYDGMCGLCHRWVKIVLRADPDGQLFYFSPLQGETITRVLSTEQRAALPDSVVVYSSDDELLTKSAAVMHILRRLGGWYKLGYFAMAAFPRPLRDFGYDCVARVRHKLFKKPDNACPMTPPEQRDRFKF